MRGIIIKPDIHRRCQIAMCGNTTVNSISRTAAPAGASFFMCDECLKEAVKARFGKVYTESDLNRHTNELLAECGALRLRVAELEAAASKCEGEAEKPQEATTNEPQPAETSEPKQGKPKGGRKK